MRQLEDLVQRIPDKFIKNPPKGKYGKYVGHTDIAQIALSKVGAHSFDVTEVVYGYIGEWVNKEGKLKHPERPRGIVSVLARLSVSIDGVDVTVTEVGTADSPHIHSDGENLKNAASDAYKRCWMRCGLGLELWVEQGGDPSPYFLPAQLEKNRLLAESDADVKAEMAKDDPERPFE
jgi:hypothetical protein